MARVISWRIDNKFVYIEDRNQHPQCIYDTQWDNERIRQHGRTVLGWSESVYEANFNYMYGKVSEQWGTATDLRSDYRFYYNATEEDGVYMLSGIDGANIADYGKPFYNLVIENANTSLGLGGDYTLDVDATVKTWIYLERNGTVYLPDEVSVKYGSETVVSRTYNEPGRTRVEIDIPRGTMFTNNERNREYEITAKKNGFEGRVLFTVVGVKDGEEGMSYDLLVHPKQIKVSSDGEISNYSVTCKILKNGEEVPQEPGRFEIRYTFGIPTTDYDDVGNVYSGPISYNTLSENGDQVNFYLYVNGRIVDTDSCIVSRDGIDGGFMKLELDNEIDAVGVGSDSKLDVATGVKFSTGMILYSAGTELTITRVVIDDGNGDQALPCADSTGKAHYSVEGLNRKYATFHTLLDNGYEFGIDLRNSVKITAYGTNDFDEQGYASANYILLGIQGAEDGVTYKLMPSADYILYDPNTRLVKWGTHEAVSVDDIGNESLVIYPLENGRQKGGGEIIADNEFLSYSVGITYSSAGSAVAPILNGEQPQNGTTFRLSELFNEEVTAENATSKFVTFYWCKQFGGNFVMIDRETVPVIIQGINGNSIWVELGNEIDAVGVGDDTDLDIEEDVTLGTTVRIISGGTPIRIAKIEVIKPRGTESNWDDYAESTTGFTGNDHATPDNGTHTIGYVSITLKNGFEFGPDYREAPTIKATADERDGGWSGFTQYVIKGIANGKDGYVYRLMPEVDYVTFNPNAGHDGTLDENEVSCRAYYGKYELGEDGFTNGTIYYSVNCIYDSIPDVIPDTSMSGAYVTGFTEYTSSVSLDEMLSKNNYWNFKYIVFYLVVDFDMPDGTVFRELVDRETVKIISDGLDAQGNATIELTNEIDSIGLGGDTILDLPAGDSRRMSTGVRVFSGGTRLSIYELTGAFQAGSNAPSGTYSFGRIPPATEDDDDVFYVDLKNGFNFGNDYKEKVIVTAKARNENNETATVSAIFVLAGIKSGKDGQTYKVQPTPDYAFYDLQLGRFIGDNNISAWAYSNGKLMSGSSTYNTDYQIKYTNNVLYDLDTAERNWGSTVFKNYDEGTNLNFYTPSGPSDREQAKVFYLAVSSDSGAHWTVVDRESVPLFINGKEGKDGVGAARFDNTNPFVVINTGDDLTLDTTTGYTTVIYGYEGVTKVPIEPAGPVPSSEGNNSSYCRVVTGYTDDNLGIKFTVNFKNWTFPDSQRITKSLAVKFRNDSSIQGSVTFTIIAVMNGKGAEGDAYKLRTNVSRIISDGAEFSPTTIRAGLYLGESTVPGCKFYFRYLPEDQVTDLSNRGILPDSLTNVSFYTESVYYVGNTNPSSANVSSQIHAQHENGVVYVGVFQDGVFLDSEDIPVQVDIDGGSSSGIIADLTDDVGVIAAGDDHLLSGVTKTLTTKAFVRSGSGGYLPITNCATIREYTCPNGGGTINITPHASIPSGGVNYLELDVHIDTSGNAYIDFRQKNPIQFDIDLTAVTSDNTEVGVKVAYSLLGLRAGVDGQTVLLELNADQIFYDPTLTGEYRFSPRTVQARLFIDGRQYTHQNDGITFNIKNSDMADESDTEMWLDPVHASEKTVEGKTYWEFPINDDDITEYEPLTVVAMSGDTLLDWETVQIYRNGVDGEGGLKLFVEPSEIPIPVENGHPKQEYPAEAILELHSGTTLDSIATTSFRCDSYSRIGSAIDNDHDIAITFGSHPTDTRLKVVNIVVSTNADLSEPIAIEISAKSGSEDQTRRAVLTLKPESGGKGERGPKTRMSDWRPDADYEAGGEGDSYWDYVFYKGNYYGCISSHTSALSTPPDTDCYDSDDSVPANPTKHWVKYDRETFTATQIGYFGDEIVGWVINKDNIVHTSSSITLDGGDGSVQVNRPSKTFYRYETSDSSAVQTHVYVDTDYKVASNFNAVGAGSYIACYESLPSSEGEAATAVYETYKLGGSYSSPTILRQNGLLTYRIAFKENEYGTPTPYAPDGALKDTIYIRVRFLNSNSLTETGTCIIYAIPAGSTVATVVTAGSFNRLILGATRLGSLVPYENEIGDGGTVPPEPYIIDEEDWEDEDDGFSQSTEITPVVPSEVIVPEAAPSLYQQKYTYDVMFSESSLSVNNDPNSHVPVSSGKYTGITINDGYETRYYYPDSNDHIYFVSNGYMNSLGGNNNVEPGSVTYVPSAGSNYSFPQNGWKTLVINPDPDGDIVLAAGFGSDGTDEGATTKIYTDGTLLTSRLKATDGEFTGKIYATDGHFSGSINATEGSLGNVNITGATFSGNIDIVGPNSISLRKEDGTGTNIRISNDRIDMSTVNITYEQTMTSCYFPSNSGVYRNEHPTKHMLITTGATVDNDTTFTTKITEQKMLSCQILAGGVITVKPITFKAEAEDGGVDSGGYGIVNAYFNGSKVNTVTTSNFIEYTGSHEYVNVQDTPEFTYTAAVDGIFELKVAIHVKIRDRIGLFDSRKLRVSAYRSEFFAGGPTVITYPQSVGGQDLRIGCNGLYFKLADGSHMTYLSDSTGATFSLVESTGSGIFIDKDTFELRVRDPNTPNPNSPLIYKIDVYKMYKAIQNML